VVTVLYHEIKIIAIEVNHTIEEKFKGYHNIKGSPYGRAVSKAD